MPLTPLEMPVALLGVYPVAPVTPVPLQQGCIACGLMSDTVLRVQQSSSCESLLEEPQQGPDSDETGDLAGRRTGFQPQS